ncbi:hypothetical protein V8E36_005201 [Tilletia maclaganii]
MTTEQPSNVVILQKMLDGVEKLQLKLDPVGQSQDVPRTGHATDRLHGSIIPASHPAARSTSSVSLQARSFRKAVSASLYKLARQLRTLKADLGAQKAPDPADPKTTPQQQGPPQELAVSALPPADASNCREQAPPLQPHDRQAAHQRFELEGRSLPEHSIDTVVRPLHLDACDSDYDTWKLQLTEWLRDYPLALKHLFMRDIHNIFDVGALCYNSPEYDYVLDRQLGRRLLASVEPDLLFDTFDQSDFHRIWTASRFVGALARRFGSALDSDASSLSSSSS